MNEKQVFMMDLGGKKSRSKHRNLAKQATGACFGRYEGHRCLSVAVVGESPRPRFLPT